MIERVIIAGSGGQGIMLLGRIVALAALRQGKQVSWIPSYGAEVRGGSAFCMVKISDAEIASPFVDNADTLIMMNNTSFDKFKHKIDNQGLIIINSSLAKQPVLGKASRRGIEKFAGEFTRIAIQLGNIKVANMVALGAYLARKKSISLKSVLKAIEEVAPPEKRHLIEINKQALRAGIKLAQPQGG